MSTSENTQQGLPQMVDGAGELVRLITASDLLRVAGLPEDLGDVELPALGTFTDNAGHLVAIAKEASDVVGAEVIRRLDQGANWTVREGGFKFTSPSKSAGTKVYNEERLKTTLRDLVTLGKINQAASDAALEPQHGTARVTAAELEEIERAVDGHGTTQALLIIDRLRGEIPATTYTQRHAGIEKLRKLGDDVARALNACQDDVDPPARKAKITREPAKRAQER